MADLYTLLLVDDEEIIRNGISRKINWENEGFRLLTPCEDGEEAIQVLQQEEPDVIITDICMPRVDGLELAKYAAENYPDTLLVILSGYEDFEYARKAIRYNVHEYLLKPLSSSRIGELLKRIRRELDRRRSYHLDLERLLLLQEENRQILLERSLCRIISSPATVEDLKSINELHAPMESDIQWFSVILLDVDDVSVNPEDGGITLNLYLLAVREIVESHLEESPATLICQPYEPRIVVIIGENTENNCSRNARFMGNRIHKKIQNLPSFSVSAGIGLAHRGMENLYRSYSEALLALENRMIAGNNGVFHYHLNEDRFPRADQRLSQIQSSIKIALRQQKGEDLAPLVHEFCSFLKLSGLSVSRIRLEIDKLVFSIIDFIENLVDANAGAEELHIPEQMAGLSKHSNLDVVENSLKQILLQISEGLKVKRRRYPETKIYDIQAYLQDHFASKNLSVEFIANRFFISPSYLGKLFKQFTGQTFIEYLTELRVSKACELLTTTNRKLFEIAEMVGYSDPGYFTSIFKKYRGITMSQYRGNQ